MVSADNLNLDVLELIFSFLYGNDLPSVALVSRSFLSAIIPRLYNSISYRLCHAKAYDSGDLASPFAVLLARPYLTVHVRRIEIQAVPMLKTKVHHAFINEASRAIRQCRNLRIFKCNVRHPLPMLLPSLQGKPDLQNLLIHAPLTPQQTKSLTSINRLQTLCLRQASWTVVDALPKWSKSLGETLTSLTLYMISELHESILGPTLANLPHLTSLHVVGCPRAEHTVVLRHISHLINLESLSITAVESNSTPEQTLGGSLPYLKNFAIDSKYGLSPSPTPIILSSVLAYMKAAGAPLESFTLKLPERKVSVSEAFVSSLVKTYGSTLCRLAFMDCSVNPSSVTEIARGCPHLERLEICFPMKELGTFATCISPSKSLSTLIDVENHVEHGVRQMLGQENARHLMLRVPAIKRIVSSGRCWTGRFNPELHDLEVSVEKRQSPASTSPWFMPRP